MNAQELFKKYATDDWGNGFTLMQEEGFIKAIAEIISQPLEAEVSQENGGRECPLCGGKNKKEFGGNDKCFHCENETCGFVQCEQSVDDVIYMVSKRIKKFYKG